MNKSINKQIHGVLVRKLSQMGEIDFLYLRQNRYAPGDVLVVGSQDNPWLSDYRQQRGWLRDPVVLAAQQRISPFNWQDCSRPNDGLCEAGDSCQRAKGYTFMLHDQHQQMSLLSIIRRGTHPGFSGRVTARLSELQMLLIALHEQVSSVPATLPALSPREQEILLWSSRGKTYPEIAIILGIALSTVKFHIGNAMRKLDVSNAKHAVRRAMELNCLPAPLY